VLKHPLQAEACSTIRHITLAEYQGQPLVQAHAAISGLAEHVDRIHEAHLPRGVGHGQGMGAAAVAEEADAVEQGAVGNAAPIPWP
jgi:hypothetical protein